MPWTIPENFFENRARNGAFSKLFSVAYEEIEKGGDFKNVVTTGTRSEGPSLRRDGVQF